MKKPPLHLNSFELRRPIHLLAFVRHEVLFPNHSAEEHFFLGFYCVPHRVGASYYLVLVDESGSKQRLFRPAGDGFEYALLIATGLFSITPMDVQDLQTFANCRLFYGHLSIEMSRYRSLLRTVHKRLSRLRMDYWKAAYENGRI